MSHRVGDDCIGCGGCEYACRRGALTKTDSFLGLFVIDPLLCDDCGDCVRKCPEGCITVDPGWATCRGHGCPLGSDRLSHYECSVWLERCPACGTSLWRAPGAEHPACPRCDIGLRVACPRGRATLAPTPA